MAGPFIVDQLPDVRDKIQAFLDELASPDDREALLRLIEDVNTSLTNDPRAFGDPIYTPTGGDVIFEADRRVTIVLIAWVFG